MTSSSPAPRLCHVPICVSLIALFLGSSACMSWLNRSHPKRSFDEESSNTTFATQLAPRLAKAYGKRFPDRKLLHTGVISNDWNMNRNASSGVVEFRYVQVWFVFPVSSKPKNMQHDPQVDGPLCFAEPRVMKQEHLSQGAWAPLSTGPQLRNGGGLMGYYLLCRAVAPDTAPSTAAASDPSRG